MPMPISLLAHILCHRLKHLQLKSVSRVESIQEDKICWDTTCGEAKLAQICVGSRQSLHT